MANPSLVLVGGERSSVGKTSAVLGLLSFLQAKGFKVAVGKAGPDFIDASYLSFLSSAPCANLDLFMHGQAGVHKICERLRLSNPDLILLEGAMGLFDGGPFSSARLAYELKAKVFLVLSAKGLGESISALAYGYLALGKRAKINYAGLILTHVGSEHHSEMLSQSLEQIKDEFQVPVVAKLNLQDAPKLAARHLGLVNVCENSSELKPATLANWFAKHCDPHQLLSILNLKVDSPKRQALKPTYFFEPCFGCTTCQAKPTLALGFDLAFAFCYADLPALLQELGLKVVFFSPLAAKSIPACEAIYLPGGYPELYAKELAGNGYLRDSFLRAKEENLLIYAECGGFMYLLEHLTLTNGQTLPMLGLFQAKALMQTTRAALGYRKACMCKGWEISVLGHEFHYSRVDQATVKNNLQPLWHMYDRFGHDLGESGFMDGNVFGSYLHVATEGNRSFWQKFVQHIYEEKTCL